MVKATYGTGGFLLLNTGETATPSRNRLLTTVAYQWKGRRAFALEGAIFSAGATVQWLRDGLAIIPAANACDALAAASNSEQAVYCVPAFAGLGAPYWSSEARALISGVTRGTTRKEIVRAALESVGYQTRDLVEAMQADCRSSDRPHPGRRRHGGKRLDDAVPRRRAGRPGRPAGRSRIDRARRRLRGGMAGRASIPDPSPSPSDAAATASSSRRWTRNGAIASMQAGGTR